MQNHDCKLNLSPLGILYKRNLFEIIKSELLYHQKIEHDWSDYDFLVEVLAKTKKTVIVKKLINGGCRCLNSSEYNYLNSPLYHAIRRNNIPLLQLILRKISLGNINHKDRLLEDIHNICNNAVRNIILRTYLREKINPTDSNNLSPFHIACHFEPDLVKQFMDFGDYVNNCVSLNSNSSFAGWSPLHFAVNGHRLKTVKLLLDHGADVNIVNKMGNPPLYFASVKDKSIINLILSKCMSDNNHSIEDRGFSITTLHYAVKLCPKLSLLPLHLAVALLNLKKIEYLLKKEININGVDNLGFTPLHVVCFSTHSQDYFLNSSNNSELENLVHNQRLQMEIVKLLINKNALVNSVDKTGRSPLHHLIQGYTRSISSLKTIPKISMEIHMELILFLIEHGADITISDNNGRTVLHYVTDYKYALDEINKIEICKVFLKKGININLATKFHKTPLCLSIENKFFQLAKYLITENANINYTCNCDEHELIISPIHALITVSTHFEQTLSLLKLLLSKGVDVNEKYKNGMTILHSALQNRNWCYKIKLILTLINYGAKIDAKNTNGQTPLHVAIESESVLGVIALLNHGGDINIEDNDGHTPISLLSKKVRKFEHKQLYDHDVYIGIDKKLLKKTVEHINKLKCLDLYVSEKNYEIIMKTFLSHYQFISLYRYNYGSSDENTNCSDDRYMITSDNESIYDSGDEYINCSDDKYMITSDNESIYDSGDEHTHNSSNQQNNHSDDEFTNDSDYQDIDLSDYESEHSSGYPALSRWDWYAYKCRREIQKLKNVKIDEYNSLYNIMFKSPQKMMLHVKKNKMKDIIKSIVNNGKFRYGYLIKLQFNRGLERSNLIDQAYADFQMLTKFPIYCIDMIFEYLSNDDLKSLIQAKHIAKKLNTC